MDAENIVNDALSRLGANNNVHKEELITLINDMQDTIECKEFRSIVEENKDIEGAEWIAITYFLMTHVNGKPIANKQKVFDGLREYFKELKHKFNSK